MARDRRQQEPLGRADAVAVVGIVLVVGLGGYVLLRAVVPPSSALWATSDGHPTAALVSGVLGSPVAGVFLWCYLRWRRRSR